MSQSTAKHTTTQNKTFKSENQSKKKKKKNKKKKKKIKKKKKKKIIIIIKLKIKIKIIIILMKKNSIKNTNLSPHCFQKKVNNTNVVLYLFLHS